MKISWGDLLTQKYVVEVLWQNNFAVCLSSYFISVKIWHYKFIWFPFDIPPEWSLSDKTTVNHLLNTQSVMSPLDLLQINSLISLVIIIIMTRLHNAQGWYCLSTKVTIMNGGCISLDSVILEYVLILQFNITLNCSLKFFVHLIPANAWPG